jgi:hypothetical protein
LQLALSGLAELSNESLIFGGEADTKN